MKIRPCNRYGEPGIIVNGVYYNCTKICPDCGEPMHPDDALCENCTELLKNIKIV